MVLNDVEEIFILRELIKDKIITVSFSWGTQSFKATDVTFSKSTKGNYHYRILGTVNTDENALIDVDIKNIKIEKEN